LTDSFGDAFIALTLRQREGAMPGGKKPAKSRSAGGRARYPFPPKNNVVGIEVKRPLTREQIEALEKVFKEQAVAILGDDSGAIVTRQYKGVSPKKK
jgi:hypothetical protein